MRAYVQCEGGVPYNVNSAAAWWAFRDMGVETVPFETGEVPSGAERGDIFVGGLGTVRARLRALGAPVDEVDYPEELEPFMGRRVWGSTADRVASHPELWPVFVKPVEGKRFTGRVVRSAADLVGCGTSREDFPVLCSEPLDMVSEWRCFLMRGRILDVRPYRGPWGVAPDRGTVEAAVAAYASAPAGCAVDFAVLADGRTVVVEVNDGYSLGSYGLEPHAYARLLSARWAELAGVGDLCDFGPMPSPLI